MKKSIAILFISIVIFACSHKTTSTVTKTEVATEKMESATVSNEQFSAGKTVYDAKCGRCHKLHNPNRGNMTQWTKWIDRMAPKAKLTADEKQLVMDYVSVNALSN